MGLITCLDVTEKKKFLAPAWNRTRGRTLVTAFTTLYRAVLGQRSGVNSSRQNMDKYSGVCYKEHNERGGLLSADVARACA
jgi:hypothetical protein